MVTTLAGSSSFADDSPPPLSLRFQWWLLDQWSDLKRTVDLHNNWTIRCCCVLLMIKCAFVALTGRGVVSIIQAIVGVIFSIEGFWGAVKFDAATLKRFLIFLVGYFFVSVGIAVIDIQTLDAYCATAVDQTDLKKCEDQTQLYAYLLLAASLFVVPLIFSVGVIFYLAIPVDGSGRRRNPNSSALEVYEMTDIVDRMGFSSD